jgi:hypothetical protein
VAGERPGVVGDAGDHIEDCCVVVVVSLPHAGCGLGDGPEKRPRETPDFAAAGALVALGGDCEHAFPLCSNLTDVQPAHFGTAQVGCEVELGVFGDPVRAAGQCGQFLYGRCELAGVGNASELVVGVPSLTCVSHLAAFQIHTAPAAVGAGRAGRSLLLVPRAIDRHRRQVLDLLLGEVEPDPDAKVGDRAHRDGNYLAPPQVPLLQEHVRGTVVSRVD